MDEEKRAVKPRTKKHGRKLPVALGIVAVVLIAAIAGFSIWHQQPTFCNAICHSPMDVYVETYYEGDGLARVHAESDVTCLDCHEAKLSQQVTEATRWLTGDFKENLDLINFDDQICLDCHDQALVEQGTATIAELEKDPHADAHQVMQCVDCHRSHRDQEDYCSNCHDNGGQHMITYPLARTYDIDTTPTL